MNDTTPEFPTGLTEIGTGMSNFDHSVDAGFEEALRAGGAYGRHAGWHFNGLVWYDAASEQFAEDVYRYQSHVGSYVAPTLQELMKKVNDEHGWD